MGPMRVLCKATVIEGRPMRANWFTMDGRCGRKPVATFEGDYRVFVRVSGLARQSRDTAETFLQGFSSDTAHTRLAFYDKAAEINQRIREDESSATGPTTTRWITRRAAAHRFDASDGRQQGRQAGPEKKPIPMTLPARQDEASVRREARAGWNDCHSEELYLNPEHAAQGRFCRAGYCCTSKSRSRSKVHGGLSDQARRDWSISSERRRVAEFQ